jgi:hypothetical protein
LRDVTIVGDGPVTRLWPGATVVCLASGPSLTRKDVAFVRGRARVIAINNTWELAPWADALWATDASWWIQHEGVPAFRGSKFALKAIIGNPQTQRVKGLPFYDDVHVLRHVGREGLSADPAAICSGGNGGYAAINLAVHLGASRILLLGYDCQFGPKGEKHWHGDHPAGATTMDFPLWLTRYATLATLLARRGVSVVNCSRQTAIPSFPRMPIEQALPMVLEAAS